MTSRLMRAAVTVVTKLAFSYTRSTVTVVILLEFLLTTSGMSCNAARKETRYAITPITLAMATAAWNQQDTVIHRIIE